uniref:Epidermal differentiation-specific protein-like n=1 Tax=Erpetoichthys calabaricus TaxID=27687 RepID=A0A8C4XFS5_ERPCA
MSTITLYKGEQLNGDKRKYHNDVSDLTVDGFDRQMASLNVQGNPWVTYNQAQFRGAQNLYTDGNYPSIPEGKRFTSMKLIKDVDAPRIILFEKINFDGPSTDLDEHTTLPSGYKVASYRVRSGAWCLSFRTWLEKCMWPSKGMKWPTVAVLASETTLRL